MAKMAKKFEDLWIWQEARKRILELKFVTL